MRTAALAVHEAGVVIFNQAELEQLHQQGVDSQGRMVAKRVGIKDHLKTSTRLFARAFGTEFSLDYQDRRWASFNRAIDSRIRFVHPRTAASLEVHEQVVRDLGDSIGWFANQIVRLLTKIRDRIDTPSSAPGADALPSQRS